MIEVKQGNCFDLLKQMGDNSVDCVITSPPYNMNLRIRNGKYCSRQIVKEISTKYQNYPDNLPMNDYFDMIDSLVGELLRVSKIVFFNVQFLTGNKPALFKILGKYSEQVKEFIIWDKVNAQPAIGEGVLNSQFEVIIVFEKISPESRRFNKSNFKRGTLSNVWSIKRGKKLDKNHGATFPEDLARTIIENFTNEGDTVLDPMAGTGTVAAVCKMTNRKSIAFEIDSDYCETIRKRIEQ